MTDEERLVDAVATAWYGGVTEHWRLNATNVIKRMREQKITLTPPPAPEPTYAIRLTADEREWLIENVGWNEWQRPRQTIAVKLRDATPDDSATE